MKTTRGFLQDADRYQFDFCDCSAKKGWAQVDTKQDASYYGTWANPFERKIVNYAEGDVTIRTADNDAEFVREILELQVWARKNETWIGVDPGWGDRIESRFRELGLGWLLH